MKILTDFHSAITDSGFSLAGGTSLALRLGHRISIDLDFFTLSDFDPVALAEQLGFGSECITGQAKGSLQLRVDDVKVEFLRHGYPKLAEDEFIEGVQMWSQPLQLKPLVCVQQLGDLNRV
jgi:hypothetical protein